MRRGENYVLWSLSILHIVGVKELQGRQNDEVEHTAQFTIDKRWLMLMNSHPCSRVTSHLKSPLERRHRTIYRIWQKPNPNCALESLTEWRQNAVRRIWKNTNSHCPLKSPPEREGTNWAGTRGYVTITLKFQWEEALITMSPMSEIACVPELHFS